MVRASMRHGMTMGCVFLALLAGICVAAAAAQQPQKPRVSLTPRTLLLPPHVVAGGQGTLAVLDSQGRLLPNVAVELPGGQTVKTDVTGRAAFVAPNAPGKLVAKISGRSISASASVLAAEVSGSTGTAAGNPVALNLASYPHIQAIHDRFSLEGSGFRGAADSNHVFLNGDPCLILAASPISLVVLPGPRVPVGDVELRLSVAGMDAGPFTVSAVMLEFSGPAGSVDAGSSGKLILHARGTTEPLLVEVRNQSPGVIHLANGNLQRVQTSGGEENIAPVDVKFVTGGNYSVSARLVSGVVESRPQP
jgi:hypothetical protein